MSEFPSGEEDEQYVDDAELEASEYGADQMAGMPGFGEMQDPYAEEVNQMTDDYKHDLMSVVDGQGAPELAEEELPGQDPWATAGGKYDEYDEEGPEGMQGPGGEQKAA